MEKDSQVPVLSEMAESDQIIAAVGDGITVHSQDFRILYQNQTMKSIFGDCIGELCYQGYRNLDQVCPDCPVARCFATGEACTMERPMTVGEETIVFETCASPVQDRSGRTIAVVEVVRNATRRKEQEGRITKLKNLYQALSRTNRAIMHSTEQLDLFREICGIAVQYGKLCLALIGTIDPETQFITPVAHSGTAATYMESLIVSADESRVEGWGPTGIALRQGDPYVCNDFHADPSTIRWRAAAAEVGIRSSAVFPLKQDGKVMGALKVYAEQKNFFDAEIVNLLMEMAESISFAINNLAREEQRRKTEEALRESEECLRLALEGSNDGIWDWNLGSGAVKVSPQFTAMLGYQPEEMAATIAAVFKLIHPDDRRRARCILDDRLSGSRSGFEIELRMATRDGRYEWILFRGKVVQRDQNALPLRVSGVASNITEKKRYQETLQFMSTHDPLTGLFNRAYFDAEMARMAQSRLYPVSIVVADIDGLKAANDNFGHAEGDRLIRQAARALQQAFRGEDMVARIGGDEFVVLLQSTDAEAARAGIKRVRRYQELINRENTDYTLSISLGSATAESGDELVNAFKLADSRMYYWKFQRKSRHHDAE